nr:unnamed protein product [Digitaria exilis]
MEVKVEDPEHLQPRCANNLDRPPLEHALEEQPLEAWGVFNDDLVEGGHPVHRDLEAAGGEAETRWLVVRHDKGEDLQLGAVREQGFEFLVADDAVEETQLSEVGERGRMRGGRLWELPNAEVEADEGGAAKNVVRERHVERPRAVEEDEVLDVLVGEVRDQAPERVLKETRVTRTPRTGPGCAAMQRERARTTGMLEVSPAPRWASSTRSGVPDHMRCQRVESAAVRPASLMGRRWMMSARSVSGRRLMWSSPSPGAAVNASSWTATASEASESDEVREKRPSSESESTSGAGT